MAALKFVLRKSAERGNTDHGWLKTFHTFSVSSHPDTEHRQFGSLRIINEDRVAANSGFGTHSHREFEIFSYIISGEITHKDSMGNTEVLKRGDVQLTSVGTGISHSEEAHGSEQAHFLQIWAIPKISGLQPKHFTRHFSDKEKQDKWIRVVAPVGANGVSDDREGGGPAPVQSELTMYATVLGQGKSVNKSLAGKKGYIHVAQTSGYREGEAEGAKVTLKSKGSEDLTLREGDGAYIFVGAAGCVNVLEVDNGGDRVSEIVFFDLD